jgi:hypothetical protein
MGVSRVSRAQPGSVPGAPRSQTAKPCNFLFRMSPLLSRITIGWTAAAKLCCPPGPPCPVLEPQAVMHKGFTLGTSDCPRPLFLYWSFDAAT